METAKIARILDEMGTLLEVRGENAFRCRAYHNAAQALKALPSELGPLIADGRLAEVPGIGETMLAKIAQLATSGHLPSYDELRRTTPPGLVVPPCASTRPTRPGLWRMASRQASAILTA